MSDFALKHFICEWQITTCSWSLFNVAALLQLHFLQEKSSWLCVSLIFSQASDTSDLWQHSIVILTAATVLSSWYRYLGVRNPHINCDQIKSEASWGHILQPFCAVRYPICCHTVFSLPTPPACELTHWKARVVTHPEVSDDEGQHVAPLPIVLSSCQAPGSR